MKLPSFIHRAAFLLHLSIIPFNLFGQQDRIFTMQNQASLRIEIDTLIHTHTDFKPFTSQTAISGLAFTGEISLFSDSSLVRIILADKQNNEYLIYEAYPVLSGLEQLSIQEAAEETVLLNNIIPEQVSVELIHASVYLEELILSEEESFQTHTKSARMHLQTLNKIDKINSNLNATGQTWMAGETSISRLSYQEKKSMFGGCVPNLQGFEYYVGGIFVLPGHTGNRPEAKESISITQSQEESPYPDEISWQNRHGKNWVTPVKDQTYCGSCVAFGLAGAVELLVNLHFNQPLDYDLSEQQILSCNGSCEEINIQSALNFIRDTGIVLEDCFPYTASDADCSEVCSDPSERISIENWNIANTSEDKIRAVSRGATVGHIVRWYHVAQVVGFKTLEAGNVHYMRISYDSIVGISLEEGNPLIGETAWIIKNSWGTDWGIDGFGYVAENDLIVLYTMQEPVNSLVFNESHISCTDNDGDGYYSWGIGPKPSHCPECPDKADGDDSDPCIRSMDEYGNLVSTTPLPEADDTTILYGNPPDLFVEGDNVRWYNDRRLQNLVLAGNLFPTGQSEPGIYTYYVTQTISGCESNGKDLTLSLVTGILPPIGHDTTIAVGEPAVITVAGDPGAVFTWYEDPDLTNLLVTGDTYSTGITEEGVYTYYVTQTVCLIESPPDTVSLTITDDYIIIHDTAFLNALILEGVDQDGDNVISPAEAEAVDSLDVSSYGITSISGLENFVNLKYLDCSRNQISNLDVSGCTELKVLFCEENQLTSLDVSGCTALNDLVCHFNQLSALEVSANPDLRRLWCSKNQLTSLDVSANTALSDLWCSDNLLTALDVSANMALAGLGCSNNQLTTLDVSANTDLFWLGCSNNQLTVLDVSSNTALWDLDCSANQLSSLDVSSNTALYDLSCNSNRLTRLDVSASRGLVYLGCAGNQLLNLDVSGCTSLEYLKCQKNQLTHLDVSGCIALSVLYCENNPLENLDASGCEALYSLYINGNPLTNLNVSGCTALTHLECSENQLTSLNVTGCTALHWLNCSGNSLTNLDVSNSVYLWENPEGFDRKGYLDISNMISLHQVCVPESLPWEGEGWMPVDSEDWQEHVDTTGSPNVYFTTECSIGTDDQECDTISIYPNPAANIITIEGDIMDHITIEVTSLNGLHVFSKAIDGNTLQLDLSSLTKGVYLVTIKSKDFTSTRKIIKL